MIGRGQLIFNNVIASLVVAILGIPMAVGCALLSHAPIAAGLVTTSLGGLVVALLGGVPMQICGPAVSMAVLVAAVVHKHGALALQHIGLLAGLLQIAAALLGVARLIRVMPQPVLQGMVASVGGCLVLAELPELLGHGATYTHCALGVGTLACGVIWRVVGLARYVPVAMVTVGGGALMSWLLALDVPKVSGLHQSGTLFHGVALLHALPQASVWLAAISVGSVGALQAVLGAASLTPSSLRQVNRQVAALGVANMACGLLAGLPVTAVLSRSAANLKAGGSGRWPSLLSGVWAALLVVHGEWALEQLPMACLAAAFIDLGIELISVPAIKVAWQERTLPAYAVTVGVAMANLLLGVAAGVATFHVQRALSARRQQAKRVLTRFRLQE